MANNLTQTEWSATIRALNHLEVELERDAHVTSSAERTLHALDRALLKIRQLAPDDRTPTRSTTRPGSPDGGDAPLIGDYCDACGSTPCKAGPEPCSCLEADTYRFAYVADGEIYRTTLPQLTKAIEHAARSGQRPWETLYVADGDHLEVATVVACAPIVDETGTDYKIIAAKPRGRQCYGRIRAVVGTRT